MYDPINTNQNASVISSSQGPLQQQGIHSYNPNINNTGLINYQGGINQVGYMTQGLNYYQGYQGNVVQPTIQLNTKTDLGLSKKIDEEINPNKKDNKFSFVDDLLKPKNK